jgi:hypothetical protein
MLLVRFDGIDSAIPDSRGNCFDPVVTMKESFYGHYHLRGNHLPLKQRTGVLFITVFLFPTRSLDDLQGIW